MQPTVVRDHLNALGLSMDNSSIGKALRAAHSVEFPSAVGRARAIRLPAEENIHFSMNGSQVHIYMKPEAVCANMQTNSAGFEGWCLALKLWLKVEDITLLWAPPEGASLKPLNRHYARFLYRVQRFAALFPDWFRIGTPEHLEDCVVRQNVRLFLNVSGAVSRDPADPNKRREGMIERGLVRDHAQMFRKQFGLQVVGRQFPVGLYRTSDLKGPVFTGGTSAIDIVGSDENRFTIIELKAGNNIMVGALGEMMFYASVIRDAVNDHRFKFGGNPNAKSHSDVRATHVTSAKGVRAILLAENFHPLLEHPDLFATLDAAASAQSHPVPLSFEGWRLKNFGDESGPSFERLAA